MDEETKNPTTTFRYHGKEYWSRELTAYELADIFSDWENPTVDAKKYYQNVMQAWETSEDFYNVVKSEGGLCQKYKNKFYIA
jgi:hypothetical protein